MAQTLLTPTEITREFLRILHSNMVFAKSMDRQYENKFANSGVSLSGKIGPSLQIRKPNQYTVRNQWTMAQQDQAEEFVTLTIDTVNGIDMNFADSELALTIDDFSKRYIDPASKRLAASVDQTAALHVLNHTYNQVGVIGSQPGTTGAGGVQPFLNAHRRIKEGLAPAQDGEVSCIISPYTEATSVGGLLAQFNPQADISGQFKTGQMSNPFGMKWHMSQVLASHTNGTRTDTTPVTVAFTSSTGSTIAITAANSNAVYNQGDVFTVAKCYAVNPETKQKYNYLQQFTVQSTVTFSGTSGSVSVFPAIVVSGAKQNVDVSAMTGSNAIINLTGNGSGDASGAYGNDIVMHRQAFAIATVDLELPKGLDMASRATSDGISLRFLRGYDIVNARMLSRMDVFYGLAPLRPEWSCRVIGAKADA